MTKLRLSPDLTLPLAIVTESVAILARRRMGKSNTAKVLVEQLFKAEQQVVVVDPKGDWWGLRSSRDGKGAGLPIVVLGGEHGDVPLESTGGELVARLVVEQSASVVIDLAKFRKNERTTFMSAFLETLYRLKAQERYRTPMMLAIDEADQIAPQKPQAGEERMLGAVDDCVRLGGQRGIGTILVSQRPAVLNKNVLTQASILIALGMTGSQDIDAMDDWIKKHGQPEARAKLMDAIAQLPRGTAWVWAPGWPDERGIFRQVAVSLCETFDSGATPKPGERRIVPKTVADVDLDTFRRDMAATIEKAKAEDPRALRAEIARLKGELAKKPAAAPAGKTKTVEIQVVKPATVKALERAVDRYDAVIARLNGLVVNLKVHEEAAEERRAELLKAREAVVAELRALRVGATIPNRDIPARTSPARTSPPRSLRPATGAGEDLPKGERAVLTAAAQHDHGVTREQLTVLTGYKRSSRDTYVQRLRERGLLDGQGEQLVATQAGVDALGSTFIPLPTGDALREHWLGKLPEGERRVFELVTTAHPRVMSRDEISDHTGYKRSSRDTYLQRLGARRLVITDRDGVRASEELFG